MDQWYEAVMTLIAAISVILVLLLQTPVFTW